MDNQKTPSQLSMVVTTTEGQKIEPDDSTPAKKKIKKPTENPKYLGIKQAKSIQVPNRDASASGSNSAMSQQNAGPSQQGSNASQKGGGGGQQPAQGKRRDSKSLTQKQLQDLHESFRFFDKDGDGFISATELGTVMRSIGQNPTDTEIRDIINECDADGNGRLDFDEFANLMASHIKTQAEMENELKQSFKVFDSNNDGYINASELRKMMAVMGEKLTDAEADALIRTWDKDGDGRIDYNEFVKAMIADNSFK
jgi:Ca2+-binding EF-hand superfamily protein